MKSAITISSFFGWGAVLPPFFIGEDVIKHIKSDEIINSLGRIKSDEMIKINRHKLE